MEDIALGQADQAQVFPAKPFAFRVQENGFSQIAVA
jgi:hypothetical protein